MKRFVAFLFVIIFSFLSYGVCLSQNPDNQNLSKVWVPDLGDGTYKNPVIHADYSDPDAIRVGGDFYLTASNFNCIPGLPILHSKDLVNWQIIGHALSKQLPAEIFDKPQHGKGAWAPAIRYHKGEYYIYYPEPDLGIYMVKAKNPQGPWDEPVLVKQAKGWIDPCPFWDEDGKAYLVHAFAGSRAGFKSLISINKMSDDGKKLLDDGVIVFDGHENHPTIEGPKIYKRNGFYYIFAPAGGVPTGWQTVLRSKNIYGPYEDKIVMEQGKSTTNGPHQGAWIELESGESWFIHFQDKEAYGRIVHLQPMKWVNDWPVIGIDKEGKGKGEPVLTYKKPITGKNITICTPQASDEFNSNSLGLQWQWYANPQPTWSFSDSRNGHLRLYSVPQPEGFSNFSDVPNLMLQKFSAPAFTATTKVTFSPKLEGEKTGLIVIGEDYSYISIVNRNGKLYLGQTICNNAFKKGKELKSDSIVINQKYIYLKVIIKEPAVCNFYYSENGSEFKPIGNPFSAKKGRWIGSKVGIFCYRPIFLNDGGYADFDWFRIDKE